MLRLPRAKVALALTACVFGASCTKRAVVTRPPPYSFDLVVAGIELPDEGVEILYDDEVIGKVKPNAPSARVTLPDEVYLVDAKGRLRARVEGSCGRQEIPLRIPFSDRAEESQSLRVATARPAVFEVDNPAVMRVYYDNDGGEQTTLTIGARILHVTAGMTGVTNIVLGSCATSRQVVVGGSRLGELAPQSGTDAIPPTSLIDMVGGHCYRRITHRYKDDGTQKPLEPARPTPPPAPTKGKVGVTKVEPDAGVAEKSPEDTTFKGARIYPVGNLQDFLTPSPPSIAVRDNPKLLTRIELARCDRGKVVAPPAASASASAKPVGPAKPPPPAPAKTKTPPRPSAPAKKK